MNKLLLSMLITTLYLLLNSCTDNNPVATKREMTSEQVELLTLVNETRKSGCQCGEEYYPSVDPVQWNMTLTSIAEAHSSDMITQNYFSHTSPDGSSPGDRITAGGYSWRTYGENIAMGYPTASAVIQGWIESPGHCKNIMNGSFTEMGIGHIADHWTQVFAAPLTSQ